MGLPDMRRDRINQHTVLYCCVVFLCGVFIFIFMVVCMFVRVRGTIGTGRVCVCVCVCVVWEGPVGGEGMLLWWNAQLSVFVQ